MRQITFANTINLLLQRNSNRTNVNLLIIGGAGFIGSHMVKRLLATKHSVTILDNLSTGYRNSIVGGLFIKGDVGDRALLDKIFSEHQFDAVLHFASFIEVGESVKKPELYYQNNLINTINLLNAMNLAGVKNFIFSSTAAIFGEPSYSPIDEIHPKLPINPYGRSKLMVEQILEDYDLAYGIKSVCLRYFNAAGSDADGELGERHEPETHLIPILLQVASGRRERMSVYGTDYSTPDGTCIRDYIHVMDLCDAHIAALDYLQNHQKSESVLLKCLHEKNPEIVIDIHSNNDLAMVDSRIKNVMQDFYDKRSFSCEEKSINFASDGKLNSNHVEYRVCAI